MATSRTTTRRLVTGGVIAVLAVVGAVVWYLTRPAPAAVDIDAAVQGAQPSADAEATGADDDGTASDAAATRTSVEGTWEVDTSIGSFSVTETTGTFVGFRIDEELSNIGATEAIGRTPDVDGAITIEGTTLSAADITADLSTIVSDESRRDDKIQSALETSQHPTATFTLTAPVDLDEVTGGETLAVDATGDLTVHGVTQPVTVPLEAVWTEDDVIVVTGSVAIALSDHEVTAPTAPIVVSVADEATVELQLYLTPA